MHMGNGKCAKSSTFDRTWRQCAELSSISFTLSVATFALHFYLFCMMTASRLATLCCDDYSGSSSVMLHQQCSIDMGALDTTTCVLLTSKPVNAP
eukprot:16396-Heterococcus_DN1.PRE.4